MLAEQYLARKDAATLLGMSATDVGKLVECGILKSEWSDGPVNPKRFILRSSVQEVLDSGVDVASTVGLLTLAEAAKLLGMSMYRVQRLRSIGVLQIVQHRGFKRLRKDSVLALKAQLDAQSTDPVVSTKELKTLLHSSDWGLQHLVANNSVEPVEGGGYSRESVNKFRKNGWATSRILRDMTIDLDSLKYSVTPLTETLQRHRLEFADVSDHIVQNRRHPVSSPLEVQAESPLGVRIIVGLRYVPWQEQTGVLPLPDCAYLKIQLRESPPKGKRYDRRP